MRKVVLVPSYDDLNVAGYQIQKLSLENEAGNAQ